MPLNITDSIKIIPEIIMGVIINITIMIFKGMIELGEALNLETQVEKPMNVDL